MTVEECGPMFRIFEAWDATERLTGYMVDGRDRDGNAFPPLWDRRRAAHMETQGMHEDRNEERVFPTTLVAAMLLHSLHVISRLIGFML